MLSEHKLALVAMDCMGYTRAHKRTVSQATGRPFMLSSSVVPRVVGELLDLG